MRISKLTIKNLRSIKNLEVTFENVTALLGGNNAGKSTILRALEIFFDAAPRLQPDDFHNRNDEDIEIIVEFVDLVPAEIEEFGTAVVSDTLTVRRIFSKQRGDDLQYEVLAKSYPPFTEVRSITNKTEKRARFNEIANATDDLEAARTADAADVAMLEWEAANPAQLVLDYRRGFFGAPNVASGKLKKKTSLHLVPAVANAKEETGDPKKSPIISLLSEISKQIYENKKEVAEFVQRTTEQFAELVDPEKIPELGGISDLLTTAVRQYYKDSKLLADWQLQDGIAVDYPKPTIRVEDHGFQTVLENVGHGLQRASLFAIIQFLAERTRAEDQAEEFEQAQSDIILLIEEPEIYQHPHKQLVISDAFHAICEDFSRSTGIRFQIVFTTHSEKFVGIHKFQSARILRRVDGFEAPSHSAKAVSVRKCAEYFAGLLGKEPMTDEAFEAKMHIFSREVCEGFFAEKVILVEGVTDKAVIEGLYRSKGVNAVAEGIVIIPVEGKTKMDKPLYIFTQLGIPTYPVFDSDIKKGNKKQKPDTNLLIQQIVESKDPEDFPSGVHSKFCAFEGDLEAYLKEQIGADKFDNLFQEICDELGLSTGDLCKTPLAVNRIVHLSLEKEVTFPAFDELINVVDKLA